MRSVLSFLLLALLPHSFAQESLPYTHFLGNSSGPDDGYGSFAEADKSPNASHVVTINLTDLRDLDWTIQISDVLQPNISDDAVLDAHVAYTTWQFSLSEHDDDDICVNGDVAPSFVGLPDTCLHMMNVQLPRNVSANWDPSSPSCTSAIGSECEIALLNEIGAGGDCDSRDLSGAQEACGAMFRRDGYNTKAYRFGNTGTTRKNGTYAWSLTEPYAPGNTTAFERAEHNLNIMLLAGPGSTKGALCNRVSSSDYVGGRKQGGAATTGADEAKEGGSGSEGDGAGARSGAARSTTPSTCAFWVGVGAIGMGVIWT